MKVPAVKGRFVRLEASTSPYSSLIGYDPMMPDGGPIATTAQIFVDNLPWNVSWQDLKDHMRSTGGRVVHVNVLTDLSGRSKGCAIVKYATIDDATRALRTLHGSIIGGREISLREDRDDQRRQRMRAKYALGELPDDCIIVERLPQDFVWQDLKTCMKQIGPVEYAYIVSQPALLSATGIVRFQEEEHVPIAIEQFNGKVFGNEHNARVVTVRKQIPLDRIILAGYDPMEVDTIPVAKLRVFVNNVPPQCSWQDLKDRFNIIGPVTNVHVNNDKSFAVIEFKYPLDVKIATARLNGSVIFRQTIFVREFNEI